MECAYCERWIRDDIGTSFVYGFENARHRECVHKTFCPAGGSIVLRELGELSSRKPLSETLDGEAIKIAMRLVPPDMHHKPCGARRAIGTEDEVLLAKVTLSWKLIVIGLKFSLDVFNGAEGIE